MVVNLWTLWKQNDVLKIPASFKNKFWSLMKNKNMFFILNSNCSIKGEKNYKHWYIFKAQWQEEVKWKTVRWPNKSKNKCDLWTQKRSHLAWYQSIVRRLQHLWWFGAPFVNMSIYLWMCWIWRILKICFSFLNSM